MKQVCQYHIIQFQPFAETGEFANIGIVLFAPRARRLLFKLLDPRQHGRITQFFEPLDGKLFTHVHHALQTELARLAEYPDAAVIEELTRPREDIIRYSPKRVLFADTEVFAQTLDGLFEHYVQRSFAHEEGYEERLHKRVRGLLKDWGLDNRFHEKTLGDEHYPVRFPFVGDGEVRGIIKPIHFQHTKPAYLIDHGLAWLGKVRQLKRTGHIAPNATLFACQPPAPNNALLQRAYADVRGQIEEEGIVIVPIEQTADIEAFAHSHI
jgi:hypothetical protein